MQPIHVASPAAADKKYGLVKTLTRFGARLAVDDDLPVMDVNCPSLNRAIPSVTQHSAALLLARMRIEELTTADRRKDEFLAMLCHELRSPLGSIQNAVAILRRRSVDDIALEHTMHALIDRQLRHMRLLAEDLLEVSRITCGQLRLQRERIDLCAVVRNAIETLESDFCRRGHRLAATWPDVPVWVDGDMRRLEQVFVNLLGNASKYTDPGDEVALSVSAYDGHAVVRVRDSGIGIAHDVLPNIFDLFVQADEAAPRSRSGLGVGLALVRMIVHMHGGGVHAVSAGLGRGSEFTVRLPASV